MCDALFGLLSVACVPPSLFVTIVGHLLFAFSAALLLRSGWQVGVRGWVGGGSTTSRLIVCFGCVVYGGVAFFGVAVSLFMFLLRCVLWYLLMFVVVCGLRPLSVLLFAKTPI